MFVSVLVFPYVAVVTNLRSLVIVDAIKMKLMNHMLNDTNFTAITYSALIGLIILADFGGYLMSLTFNSKFGDIE